MLLPSAFSCDGAAPHTSKSQRPKLQSFSAYQPQAPQHSQSHSQSIFQHARPSPLSSTCRALQAILGTPSAQPALVTTPTPTPPELDDPFIQSAHRNPAPSRPSQQQQHQEPTRGANKRRRSEFEQDLSSSGWSSDIQMEDEYHPRQSSPRIVRTPKRRRCIPLAMPLGLCADDFRALEPSAEETQQQQPQQDVELEMPPMMSRQREHHHHHHHHHHQQQQQHQNNHHQRQYSDRDRDRDSDSAYGSSPSTEDGEWTIEDDRALVETVLEKFRLSRRDWNDCARILGKDRDSLGKRWSLLVGEGNVGLRRGGRISRTNLDIESW